LGLECPTCTAAE